MEEEKLSTMGKIYLSDKVISRLFVRLSSLYKHSWAFNSTEELQACKSEWAKALGGINLDAIGNALDELAQTGDSFPPSLPVFVKMCRNHTSLPSEESSYNAALRRDFENNPIAKLCYEKIGSWAFTHDTEEVLKRKFKKAYANIIQNTAPDLLRIETTQQQTSYQKPLSEPQGNQSTSYCREKEKRQPNVNPLLHWHMTATEEEKKTAKYFKDKEEKL